MPTFLQPQSNTNSKSILVDSLGEPGVISTQSALENAQAQRLANEQLGRDNQIALARMRNEFVDYIRLRLADQLVDVELDKEHYDLSIKQALVKYRQRSSNAVEESFVFLDLEPDVQEYILPSYIEQVRAIYRRGIGSTTGTTASNFEPFASGYMNTYMLVAGRVGGLASYEMFAQYQELAMMMFGGYMTYTWNRVTKKINIGRKVPGDVRRYTPVNILALTATTDQRVRFFFPAASTPDLTAGDIMYVRNPGIVNWVLSGTYTVTGTGSAEDGSAFNYIEVTLPSDSNFRSAMVQVTNPYNSADTVYAVGSSILPAVSITSPKINHNETVMLHVYNYKPDAMLLSDPLVMPWLQEYALAFAKSILGQGRGKFASIAGPQGGGQLNGAALLQESQAEMERLELDLVNYKDGGTPLTWVTG